jgi:CDP-4-dehydro-6-deoxyglucose reductase
VTSDVVAPKKRIIYRAHVERIVDHTKDFRELFLKLDEPKDFSFRAGQFLMLHVPAATKPILRAYSIASSDQDKNSLALIFKYIPNGVASEFVWKLKENNEFQFTGPFGKVFLKEPISEQIIFLCTGSGVAQHICFLKSHINQLTDKSIYFFMGLTSESDVYFEDELKKISQHYKKFKYQYVLSRPSELWGGPTGYVQDQLKHIDFNKVSTDFYLCGNGHMIKQTREMLAAASIPPTQIIYEAFD